MMDRDIVSFGATGDGAADNSRAFAAAMEAIKEAGGGKLRVGKGVWRTGPVTLFSNTTLHLEEGAVISFIPELERYTPVLTRWEGVECYAMHPLVFASGAEHVAITGKGCLDGNGLVWWNLLREKHRRNQREPESPQELELARLNSGYKNKPGGGGGRGTQFLRPPLVQFFDCTGVVLEGISLKNSPFWTLHPVFCRDIKISGITIENPRDAPNTDGIDIDSSTGVAIENCRISVGDDGIALKAGSEKTRPRKSTGKVTVRNCTVENAHGGIVIGSETAGDISEVLAEHCLFRETDRGIRIKSRRGRGGQIRDLEFRNLTMEDNLCPLAINMYYRCGAEGEEGKPDGVFSLNPLPLSPATPRVKNIFISDIRASGCRASAGFIAGLPEAPVENLRIYRSVFSTDEGSPVSPDKSDMFLGIPPVTEKSFRLLNVKDPEFREVAVTGPAEAFIRR
ncbi:MAG: glycoside hydrolase family 28 protein [Treponema sp.]|jgi:polygalacturonase|nr:glycoside hydrolase family 28 protein [Treponema sp.]